MTLKQIKKKYTELENKTDYECDESRIQELNENY